MAEDCIHCQQLENDTLAPVNLFLDFNSLLVQSSLDLEPISNIDNTYFSLNQIFNFPSEEGANYDLLQRLARPRYQRNRQSREEQETEFMFRVLNGFVNGTVVESIDQSFGEGPTILIGFKEADGGIDLQDPLAPISDYLSGLGDRSNINIYDLYLLKRALTKDAQDRFGQITELRYDPSGAITEISFENVSFVKAADKPDLFRAQEVLSDGTSQEIRFVVPFISPKSQ